MTAPPRPDQGSRSPAHQGRSRDELALAERLLAAANGGADVRARKVRRLRAAIKVRAYENDLKLAVALERMVESLGERLNAAGRQLPQGGSGVQSADPQANPKPRKKKRPERPP